MKLDELMTLEEAKKRKKKKKKKATDNSVHTAGGLLSAMAYSYGGLRLGGLLLPGWGYFGGIPPHTHAPAPSPAPSPAPADGGGDSGGGDSGGV